MFKRHAQEKEVETVNFSFHCFFWERHKSLWELKVGGLPGTAGGRERQGTVAHVWLLSRNNLLAAGPRVDPGRVWAPASEGPQGVEARDSPLLLGGHSVNRPWPLIEGPVHANSMPARVGAGRWETPPCDAWSRHGRHLPENLRENKCLPNTVIIHTQQRLECVRKRNLQDVGKRMWKPSQADVKWFNKHLGLREQNTGVQSSNQFPFLFLHFRAMWKQTTSNLSHLDDQHVQSIGSLATRVTDFRKQKQQKQ